MIRRHLTDGELAAWVDSELDGSQLERVAGHLQICDACRERAAGMERMLSRFLRLQPNPAPASASAEARLRRQLVLRNAMPGATWRRHAVAAAITCLTVGAGAIALLWVSGNRATAQFLPDARLTPGVTRALTREQVCRLGPENEDGPAPKALAARVFEQYGIGQPRPKAYEVDYLITPALGGADDIRNLWPQPYADTVWTAHVKDALEDHLRTLVCSGKADLATVQREIANDWITTYRKYFATRQPLAAHREFLKDQPWE